MAIVMCKLVQVVCESTQTTHCSTSLGYGRERGPRRQTERAS